MHVVVQDDKGFSHLIVDDDASYYYDDDSWRGESDGYANGDDNAGNGDAGDTLPHNLTTEKTANVHRSVRYYMVSRTPEHYKCGWGRDMGHDKHNPKKQKITKQQI